MGNGASVNPGEAYETENDPALDEIIETKVKLKVRDSSQAVSYQEEVATNKPVTRSFDNEQTSYGADTAVDDDSPVEVLLEYIPYYGKDDPANDALVRSTLSNLSISQIDTRDMEGNTLLLLACQYGCQDLVRMMLNKGADPNAINSHGVGCLHFACYRESASRAIAKVLLQHGAHPEIQEVTYGCTPLHYCAGNGDIDFCKLLLSHGAQVDTYDYYNYTCVDYAREAGMNEAANYLQEILVKTSATKLGRSAAGSPSSKSSPQKNEPTKYFDSEGSMWQPYLDQTSGQTYMMHSNTGEVLWESDFMHRMSKSSTQPGPAPSSTVITSSPEAEQWVVTKACRARLIGLFSKADPIRLAEVDTLLAANSGKELELMNEIAKKYNITGEAEYIAFQKKLRVLKGLPEVEETKPLLKTASAASMDPMITHAVVQETIAKYEVQIEELKTKYRAETSEKDGAIAKLQVQVDSFAREKSAQETEKAAIQGKLAVMQSSGNQALVTLEAELKSANLKINTLEKENSELLQSLKIEQDRLKSLETSMSSLTSNQADRMEAEKVAADERSRQQKEREQKFALDLSEAVAKVRDETEKVKKELERVKQEHEKSDNELKLSYETLKTAKDRELNELTTQTGDKISALSRDLSIATLECADAVKRADAAEALQKLMQSEILESRQVLQFNTQLHKDLLREQNARKRLHNEMEDLKGRIRVYARIRPFSKSEEERGSTEAVVKDGKLTVLVKQEGNKKVFDFDGVFGGVSSAGNSQADIFRDTKHLIMSVVDGYNVCIFAYGQTGSGKTFTMIGAADIGECLQENGDFDELAGITPRAVSELFRLLSERNAQSTYVVEVSMFQLYRDNIEDLLASKKPKKKGEDEMKFAPLKITLAEHSSSGLVMVEGAEVMAAESPSEVMRIFALGSSRRTTASTQMNAESSRSHLICCLVAKQTNRKTGVVNVGKLTLVDLAGSERVDKTGATGELLKEAQSINKSLSAIGDVIAALTSGSAHTPYRNHPLTMLMSDSLGGNAKTLMFVNTSPADYNVAESTSSLNFGLRCKDITNSVAGPQAGQSHQQIKDLKKELSKLKKDAPKKAPTGGGLARPV